MLHAFYNPADWDSCLAAWATRHALGDAVELHPGELSFHENMLLLQRPDSVEYKDEPTINVLTISTKQFNKTNTRIFVGNLYAAHKFPYAPCCLSAWQNFHVSNPPAFILQMDKLYGKSMDADPAFNALLGIPWTMRDLDKFITNYEDPRHRAHLLADGSAIMAYRKLRGDLCPH